MGAHPDRSPQLPPLGDLPVQLQFAPLLLLDALSFELGHVGHPGIADEDHILLPVDALSFLRAGRCALFHAPIA